MILPLKTRILKYAIDTDQSITADRIMQDLQHEYQGEKQFTKRRIEAYLDSFLGIEFMKADQIEFDEDGQLILSCSMTEYGKSRRRYIP